MAQVTHILTAQQRIDPYLDYLLREWASVPNLAREWAAWEEPDRLDLLYEWPIREDRLAELATWAGQGLLTPAQRLRHDALLALVERHRPLLDAVFAERVASRRANN